MEIKIAKERVLLLQPQLDQLQATELAQKQKQNAFGAVQKVSGLLRRANPAEYKLTYTGLRYMPFWHIIGTSQYVYDRRVDHRWPTQGPEVFSMTLHGQTYEAEDGKVMISVVEHCRQEETEDRLVNGLTTAKKINLLPYLSAISQVCTAAELKQTANMHVVVPPQIRASVLVRETVSSLIQKIDADVILQELVTFRVVDLYYRPSYVFAVQLLAKHKEASIEIDAITSEVTFTQGKVLNLVSSVFDYDLLFDIGKDAAGMFIPGGGIAMKIAKKYIDVTKRKK